MSLDRQSFLNVQNPHVVKNYVKIKTGEILFFLFFPSFYLLAFFFFFKLSLFVDSVIDSVLEKRLQFPLSLALKWLPLKSQITLSY